MARDTRGASEAPGAMDDPSSVFAIGDVHGCAEELRALIQKLPLKRDSLVVFLGDYIDRGPEAAGVHVSGVF